MSKKNEDLFNKIADKLNLAGINPENSPNTCFIFFAMTPSESHEGKAAVIDVFSGRQKDLEFMITSAVRNNPTLASVIIRAAISAEINIKKQENGN